MSFVLIPGAGGVGYAWSRVAERLAASGHQVMAPDLPTGKGNGLTAYADAVAAAAAGLTDVNLVAHSLGGFTAALVAQRLPVAQIFFLNAMIPVPYETAGEWWEHVGFTAEKDKADREAGRDPNAEFDIPTYFFHDVSDDDRHELELRRRAPDGADAFTEPARFDSWPEVPLHVMAGEEDRFFPPSLQVRIARERLGIETITVPGGHMAAISHPDEIVATLILESTTPPRLRQ